MESVEAYIRRMLEQAGELLTEIVSLSGVVNQVDTDEVQEELDDKVSDFVQALNNASDEIRYV